MMKQMVLKSAAIVAIALGMSAISVAQSVQQQLTTAYQRFCTAKERHDVSVLREMLLPGFVLDVPGAGRLGRDAYLAALDARNTHLFNSRFTFKLNHVRTAGGATTAHVSLKTVSDLVDDAGKSHATVVNEDLRVHWRKSAQGHWQIARIDVDVYRVVIDGKLNSSATR